MFGTYTLKAVLAALAAGALAGFLGCLWWTRAPLPVPEQLVEAAKDAAVAAGATLPTGDEPQEVAPPGSTTEAVTDSMGGYWRLARPVPSNPPEKASEKDNFGQPSEPGRAGVVPAAETLSPSVEGPAPVPDVTPADLMVRCVTDRSRLPDGTPAIRSWGDAGVMLPGPVEVRRGCAAGEICWDPPGSPGICREAGGCPGLALLETNAFDWKPPLKEHPPLPRLFTLGLTLSTPDPEIALPVAFWREGRRVGFVGAVRYSLDPATTDRVEPAGPEHYYGGPSYRTFTEQPDRLRFEAGLALRF